MPDFRALGQPDSPQDKTIRLDRDESHHLVSVNRAQVGHVVVVFNGRGDEWSCRLVSAHKAGAELKILEHRVAPPLPFQISLAQALPKGQAMDGIIRKATEIGARAIFPLVTERTQVHLEGEREDRKREKWQTAAVEAAKQCGNPFVPSVHAPESFEAFLARSSEFDLRLIASLHPGTLPLDEAFTRWVATQGRLPGKAVWLVGPEGDFSPSELEQALAAGFQPVTLGPLVLRCETAATYALAVLSHEWQRATRSAR